MNSANRFGLVGRAITLGEVLTLAAVIIGFGLLPGHIEAQSPATTLCNGRRPVGDPHSGA